MINRNVLLVAGMAAIAFAGSEAHAMPIPSEGAIRGFAGASVAADGSVLGGALILETQFSADSNGYYSATASGDGVSATVDGSINPSQTTGLTLLDESDVAEDMVFVFELPITPIFGPVAFEGNASTSSAGPDRGLSYEVISASGFFVDFLLDGTLIHSEIPGPQPVPGGTGSIPFGPSVFDCGTLAGGCDMITTIISFRDTADGDSISFNAFIDVEEIPAPATLALFGLGVVGIGLYRRSLQRA